MQSLINGLKNIPKKALRRSRKSVDDIKNKRPSDNARSAKLQNSLDKIQRRIMNDTTERLKGLIFASAATIKKLDGLLERNLNKHFKNGESM